MLFGPNSAGKSSIQDALELYQMALKNQSSYEEIQKLLKRHWRRSGSAENKLAGKMHISVTHLIDDVSGILAAIFSSRDLKIPDKLWKEIGDTPLDFVSQFEFFPHPEGLKGDFDFIINYQLFQGDVLLVGEVEAGICVNIAHPLLIATPEPFANAAKLFPAQVSLNNGMFTIKSGITEFQYSGADFYKQREKWLDLDYFERYEKESAWHGPELQRISHETSLLVGALLSSFHMETNFASTKVDASRKVPTRKDLTFELDGWDDQIQQLEEYGDPQYYALAISLASELFPEPRAFKELDVDTRRSYADQVNRILADHLFLDQGYRLDYDYRVLLNKRNSKAAWTGKNLDRSKFGFIVEIFLRDSAGRKHAVEDVGSGIGYILPVLCSLFDTSKVSENTYVRSPLGVRNFTGFIQQPELHLHPALQAALGDAFIESSGPVKQIFVETHSEHLLLRLLKRIRQTHLDVAIAPELRLHADDLCVLYFDPSIDGTTKVKRLRITEDGEFMDRWPRGFFGERDLELFDE